MKQEKKVSVIVPAYNVEKYIDYSIGSLTSQSYNNIEIIAIDDGSTDKTFELLEKLAQSDGRIKAVHQNNSGVSSARNHGISLATGEYIFFLDADDIAEPFAIEKMMIKMEYSDAELIECNYTKWNGEGLFVENIDFTQFGPEPIRDEDKIRFITDELLQYHMGFEVWNKLYRLDIINRNGLKFDVDCKMGEDLVFNIKYLLNCSKIASIPERCIRYCLRQGSAMSDNRGLDRRVADDLVMLECIWKYVHNEGKVSPVSHFDDLFVKILDHAFSKCTFTEAALALKVHKDRNIVIENYKKLNCTPDNFRRLYKKNDPNRRMIFHLYVRKTVGAGRISDVLFMVAFTTYYRLTGQGSIKNWRLP